MKTSKLNISITKSDFSSLKIAVISTNWNEEIIKPMLDDCVKRLEENKTKVQIFFVPGAYELCLLYTSPSPRDATLSRMPSSA